MSELTFGKVWDDLTRSLQGMDCVATLTQRVRNKVVSVSPTKIVVESERTGNARALAKKFFRPYVDRLLNARRVSDYDIPENASAGVGAVILAILAILPYVTYRTEPTVLFLRNEGDPPTQR